MGRKHWQVARTEDGRTPATVMLRGASLDQEDLVRSVGNGYEPRHAFVRNRLSLDTGMIFDGCEANFSRIPQKALISNDLAAGWSCCSAGVAELVDAPDLGSGAYGVGVRVPSPAPLTSRYGLL